MAAPKINYKGTTIEALGNLARNPFPALKLFAVWWIEQMRAGFRKQGRGKPWAPRRVPNIPMALRDLENSSNVKSRRFEERPALIDTGALRDSLAWRKLSNHRIAGGTVLGYAALHQFGGVSEVPITPRARTNLAKWLKTRGKKDPEARKQFGWLFRNPGKGAGIRVEALFRVTARPFVEFLKEDRTKLIEFWGKAARSAAKGKGP